MNNIANPQSLFILAIFGAAMAWFFYRQYERMTKAQRQLQMENHWMTSSSFTLDGKRNMSAVSDGSYIRQIGKILAECNAFALKKKIERYIVLLENTRQFYDPELFIRQEYRQQEYSALVGSGSTFVQLGLVGTFLGLVIGLISIDTSSPETLAISINDTLAGMAIAFLTSLLGLILALIYGYLARRYEDCYELWEDNLSSFLGQCVAPAYCFQAEGVLNVVVANLAQTLEKMGDSSAGLAKVSSDVAEAMKESSSKLSVSSEKLSEVVDRMEKALIKTDNKEVLEQISSTSNAISTSISEMLASTTKNNEMLKKIGDQQMISLSELNSVVSVLPGLVDAVAETAIVKTAKAVGFHYRKQDFEKSLEDHEKAE